MDLLNIGPGLEAKRILFLFHIRKVLGIFEDHLL
jgi:hypothetical protein